MATTISSSVTKVLKDFDDHARALATFEACVISFAKGAGVALEIIGLTMEGDDLCATILVPSPPLVKNSQRLRVHITIGTKGMWKVTLDVDPQDEETPDLVYAFHAQYAQSLMSICMQAFLDATVVLNW